MKGIHRLDTLLILRSGNAVLEMKSQSGECRDSIRGMGTTRIIRGLRSVISKRTVQAGHGTRR
jgi:hypothetical protein